MNASQLARLNAKNGIVIGLMGTDVTYKIELTNGVSLGQIYANDNEDVLLGQVNGLKYSQDNGQTWHDYTATLAGPTKSFTFKASQDQATSCYVPLKNLSVFEVSFEAKNNPATNFLDGNPNTSWESQADGQRYFAFALDKPRYINKLQYQTTANTGAMQSCMVYTSMDGQS